MADCWRSLATRERPWLAVWISRLVYLLCHVLQVAGFLLLVWLRNVGDAMTLASFALLMLSILGALTFRFNLAASGPGYSLIGTLAKTAPPRGINAKWTRLDLIYVGRLQGAGLWRIDETGIVLYLFLAGRFFLPWSSVTTIRACGEDRFALIHEFPEVMSPIMGTELTLQTLLPLVPRHVAIELSK